MTRLDWAVLAAVFTALFAVCVWQAGRSDRARDARAIVAGCEALCRTAAAGPYHLTEETDQP
jgi:hypothetical protein